MTELPRGWVEAELAELCDVNPRVDHELSPEDAVTFVPMAAVDEITGTVAVLRSRPLNEVSKGFTKFQPRDVLFAKITPCMENGKSAIVPELTNGVGYGSTEFHVFRSNGAVVPEYIWRFIRQESFRDDAKGAFSGVVGQQRVPTDYLRAHILPVPPLPEQRRIVAKVDGLTARTARARTELNRIPILVARYRQRLLALAFSGELTAEWRTEGHPEVCSVGEVAEISSGYGFPKDRQGKTEGDFPFAKVSDISRAVSGSAGLLETAYNYVDEVDLVTLRARPVPPGSTVFAKIGEALKINRRAITLVPLILDNNCMALTPILQKVLPKYLFLFMRTVDLGPLSVATSVPSVRRGDVSNLQILLPTLSEQAEIVRRIEAAFRWLDHVVGDYAVAAKLLPKLDAAILAKAFRGELVPQDPADEPASALLDRIRASRAAAPKAKRGRRAA